MLLNIAIVLAVLRLLRLLGVKQCGWADPVQSTLTPTFLVDEGLVREEPQTVVSCISCVCVVPFSRLKNNKKRSFLFLSVFALCFQG